MKPTGIEKKLAKLTYPEIEKELTNVSTDMLLHLIDSRSIKIGNVAVEVLGWRNQYAPVIARALQGQVYTRLGKLRTLFFLKGKGLQLPEAVPVYLTFLHDRNPDVVDSAIFALVLFQDKTYLPDIQKVFDQAQSDTKVRGYAQKAIEAIEKGDPTVYCSSFRDGSGIWQQKNVAAEAESCLCEAYKHKLRENS